MKNLRKPTKSDQQIAIKSYQSINNVIDRASSSNIEIEIEESHEKIILPKMAVELLGEILKSMSEGIPISIVPEATEVTTQKAAEKTGEIEFIKVGKHRRINIEDVYKYKLKMKETQKQRIIEMMNFDEEIGLYDI